MSLRTDSLLSQFPLAFWASHGREHGYRVVLWNDAAAKMYGISTEQAVGAPFTDLFVSPDARPQAEADADAVIGGQPHPANCIARDQRPDGAPLILLTNVFRLEVDDTVLHAEISVDLTDSQVSRYLDEAVLSDVLASPYRTIDFLLVEKERADSARYMQRMTGMAHEVRSEVATVRQMLFASGLSADVEPIVKACDRAGDAVATLLVHAQAAASGGVESSVAALDEAFVPEDVIKRVVSRYGNRTSPIRLEQSAYARHAEVRGNVTDFELALSNIIGNAVRHGKDGTTVDVSVHLSQRGRGRGGVVVLVSNVPRRDDSVVRTSLDGSLDGTPPSSHFGLSVVKLLALTAHASFEVGMEGRYVIARLEWPVDMARR